MTPAGGGRGPLAVVPAVPDRWADVEMVFGTRGDPSRCWCQWFVTGARVGAGEFASANRAALREQVGSARPPGVLAFRDGEPLGWCAVAPRPGYGRLRRSPLLRGTPASELMDPGVWSVTCFVVRPGARRQGVASALLTGAVEFARAGGARVVEGYPVDAAARRSTSSAELYHGPLAVFAAAGFREVARPSPARAVVRLEL